MLKGRTSLMIAFMLAGLIVLLSCTGVFAGDGSGSGGGKGNPLSLVSANPADGQKDVSLSPEITLNFSKNVVNMSVKDNNQKCFTLNSADGTQIPVEVIMADDQIEPEKKDIIAVSPTVELSPDTQYILKILADLTSKNGTTLEKTVSITFYTEKGTGTQGSTDASPVSGAAVNSTSGNGNKVIVTVLVIVVILVAIAAYFKFKKR